MNSLEEIFKFDDTAEIFLVYFLFVSCLLGIYLLYIQIIMKNTIKLLMLAGLVNSSHAVITITGAQDTNYPNNALGTVFTGYTTLVSSSGLGTPTFSVSYVIQNVNLSSENGPASANIPFTVQFSAVGGNVVNGGASGLGLGVDGVSDASDRIDPGESITASFSSSSSFVVSGGFNNFQVYDISDVADQFDVFSSDYAPANQNDVNGNAGFGFFTGLGGGAARNVGVSGDIGEVSFGNLGFTLGVVPEPTSSALLGLSGLALLARRKR